MLVLSLNNFDFFKEFMKRTTGATPLTEDVWKEKFKRYRPTE
jgi:hypothetical protein